MKLETVKFSDVDWDKLPKDCLWGREDEEYLTCFDIHDAIESAIDDLHPDPIKGVVEVVCYVHKELDLNWLATIVLDSLLENMDDEYGGPDDATTPTKNMKEATKEYVDKIAAEYSVWQCEPVLKVEVDAIQWARENAPEWLED